MSQPNLFDSPVPYQRGSETSEEAAQAIQPEVADLRRRVMQAFVLAGPEGKTADEIATMLRLSVLAVRPRVTELYQAGAIEPTGEKRANRSGLRARVLRART